MSQAYARAASLLDSPRLKPPAAGDPKRRSAFSPPNRESTAPEGIGRCHTAARPRLT